MTETTETVILQKRTPDRPGSLGAGLAQSVWVDYGRGTLREVLDFVNRSEAGEWQGVDWITKDVVVHPRKPSFPADVSYALSDCINYEENTQGDCGGRVEMVDIVILCETCRNREAGSLSEQVTTENDTTRERVVALVADLANTLSDPTQAWDIAVADFNHDLADIVDQS